VKKFYKTIFFSALSIILAVFAMPAWAKLVPCEGLDCRPCHFFLGFKNIINFIVFTLTPPTAFVMIMASGLILIFGGSESARTMGKKMFTSVIIGLVIIYTSWVIVNTIMYEVGRGVGAQVQGNWYSWNLGCP